VRRFLILLLLMAFACNHRPRPSEFVLRIAVPGPLKPFHPLVDETFTAAAADLVVDSILVSD
jgi:hypothetical protein